MDVVLACMSVYHMCVCWGSQKREKDFFELELWLVVSHHMGVGELNQILCQKQNNKTKQKLNVLIYQVTSLAQILNEDKIVFNICACGAHMLQCVHGKVIGRFWESAFSFHSGVWRGLGLSGCPSIVFACWAIMQARFWNLTGYLRVLFSHSRSHVVNLREQNNSAITLIHDFCHVLLARKIKFLFHARDTVQG